MKPGLFDLYARLADGKRHNGAALAAELGITRAAVWKRMQALREMGLEVSGTAGDGYRLPRPVELLDAAAIRSRLATPGLEIEVAGAVDSTNARLAESGSAHRHAMLAECQTAGRGRRGRGWLSPPGTGLYLSLAWHFESGLAGLAPLSLVVGLTVAETLHSATGAEVKVKWPNDLFIDDAKLGGCLVELGGAAEGPCRAVIGVGLNLHASATMADVDQPWTALARHADAIDRNHLAAALLDGLAAAMERFDREGFDAFAERWPAFDALAGRPVRLTRERGEAIDALADGIDASGRLKLRSGNRDLAVASGEVSVRVR